MHVVSSKPMPWYRRAYQPGGSFFFTVVTEDRAPILCTDLARRLLHESIDACRRERPFSLDAIVLLPDHLHTIWTLVDGDPDFSGRWAAIKSCFTRAWLSGGGSEQPGSDSRHRQRRRGVWQRRFWEHALRDQEDLNRHLDYIHYNPVKHGMVTCPHAWPWSSFHRWVEEGAYDRTWQCVCHGPTKPPQFADMPGGAGE